MSFRGIVEEAALAFASSSPPPSLSSPSPPVSASPSPPASPPPARGPALFPHDVCFPPHFHKVHAIAQVIAKDTFNAYRFAAKDFPILSAQLGIARLRSGVLDSGAPPFHNDMMF